MEDAEPRSWQYDLALSRHYEQKRAVRIVQGAQVPTRRPPRSGGQRANGVGSCVEGRERRRGVQRARPRRRMWRVRHSGPPQDCPVDAAFGC